MKENCNQKVEKFANNTSITQAAVMCSISRSSLGVTRACGLLTGDGESDVTSIEVSKGVARRDGWENVRWPVGMDFGVLPLLLHFREGHFNLAGNSCQRCLLFLHREAI